VDVVSGKAKKYVSLAALRTGDRLSLLAPRPNIWETRLFPV